MHRYLLETRPSWFVRFNEAPQPSLLANGLGEHVLADVRLPEHVLAVTGVPAVAPPDIRLSSFELTDGYNLRVGLPDDVASWWMGAGRRVALMGSKEALSTVAGRSTPLEELAAAMSAASPTGACILDVTRSSAAVITTGGCGAIHVRDGVLLALTTAGALTHWNCRDGDRIVLLSPALFARAREAGVGPLPAQLATAEPAAWAQSVDTPARRLAVSVAIPRPRDGAAQ